MQTAQIEPFIDAAVGMFRDLLGMDSEHSSPYYLEENDEGDWDISGIIGIGGDTRGAIAISFTAEVAAELTGRLVGRSVAADDPDVADAVGEMTSIVAGNAKKGLEQFRLTLTSPSIQRGADHPLALPTEASVVGVPFRLPAGKIRLSVGLENIISM
jgi:chemotaxis protein CheX